MKEEEEEEEEEEDDVERAERRRTVARRSIFLIIHEFGCKRRMPLREIYFLVYRERVK